MLVNRSIWPIIFESHYGLRSIQLCPFCPILDHGMNCGQKAPLLHHPWVALKEYAREPSESTANAWNYANQDIRVQERLFFAK